MRLGFRSLGLVAFVIISFVWARGVSAGPSPTGITVSPAFQQVSVASDLAQTPINFTVTNDKNQPQTLELSVADFNTLDESGGLFFVGTNQSQLAQKYGLAKWVSLPNSTLTIPPKATVTINGQILNLPDLAPGGHYGALNIAVLDNTSQAGNSNVAIHPIASSLLFVTKLGGDTHILKLSQVFISRNVFSLPSSITLRFQNVGNTHVIPRGYITITDPRGKLVSKGIVNQNSGLVLPQKYRDYPVPLQKMADAKLPGRYKINVNYRFDGYNNFRAYQTSYWIIGGYGLSAIILVLIVVFSTFWVVTKKPAVWRQLIRRSNKK